MREPYHEKVWKEIDEYAHARESGWLPAWAGPIGDAVSGVFKKIGAKVPAEITAAFVTALQGALGMVNDAAQWSYSTESVLAPFRQAGYEPANVAAIADLPLEACDRIAQTYIQSNKLIGALEGGVTGAGGLAMMAADLPAVMAINFRMIGQIANSFGYDTTGEIEKIYMLNVFTLGSATGVAGKFTAMGELKKIAMMAAKGKTWKELETFALVKVIQEVAEKVGVRLTKRKLGQVIPILGAGVGAGMNYVFTRDNGVAAWMAYRGRRIGWAPPQAAGELAEVASAPEPDRPIDVTAIEVTDEPDERPKSFQR